MRSFRSGYILLEAILAAALLAVLMTVSLRMLSAISAQRRAAEQRAIALEEVANLMERALARPWNEISSQSASPSDVDDSLQRILPGAAATMTVEPSDDTLEGKHLHATITWKPAASRPDAAVTLHFWAYPEPKASAP
jgi:type II secretory pathway pseudopilin PulG